MRKSKILPRFNRKDVLPRVGFKRILLVIGGLLPLSAGWYLLLDSTYLNGQYITLTSTSNDVCAHQGLNYSVVAAGLTLTIAGICLIMYAIRREPVSYEIRQRTKSSGISP